MIPTEVELRSTLKSTASTLDPPPVDLGALVEDGRAHLWRRRVNRALTAAVASATVALGGALAYGLGSVVPPDSPVDVASNDPASVESLDVGAPPSVPYCCDEVLTIGREEFGLPGCRPFRTAGDTTLSWTHDRVLVLGEERFEPLTRLSRSQPADWVPVLSSDGRLAAWVDRPDGAAQSLVLWDVVDRREIALEPLPGEGRVLVFLVGIDDLGRVYVVAQDARVWVFDPRTGRMVPVIGTPPHVAVSNVLPDGVAVMTTDWEDGHSDTSTSHYGRVTADGHFVSLGERETGVASFSPRGDRLVQDLPSGFWVGSTDSPRPGHDLRLRVPRRGGPAGAPVWESEDAVLMPFWATDGERSVIRCFVADGGCEVALASAPVVDRAANPLGSS